MFDTRVRFGVLCACWLGLLVVATAANWVYSTPQTIQPVEATASVMTAPVDVTAEMQTRFNNGDYDVTWADGCGVTSVTFKHAVFTMKATKAIKLYVLPLNHPTNPQLSKSVPMFNFDQKTVNREYNYCIIDPDCYITIDGQWYKPIVVDQDKTEAEANPTGLYRNVFDQLTNDPTDCITHLEINCNFQNLAGTAVSLTNANAIVKGSYQHCHNKCLGVSYSLSSIPMTIDYGPRFIDDVWSCMDFSAPMPLKDVERDGATIAVVHGLCASGVVGRSKCHACAWVLDFENIAIDAPPGTNVSIWAGFTIANESIRQASFRHCRFRNFLRAGLELRNTSGPVYIEDLEVDESINGMFLSGSRPVTFGGTQLFRNCKNIVKGTLVIPAYTYSLDPGINWDERKQLETDLRATYGLTTSFPN